MVEAVRSQAIGAAVPGLSTCGQLRDLRVAITDLPTQRRIATVLGAFDDLIKINEQRIALLDDLARSLYREWFVRFRFPGHEDVELVGSEIRHDPRRMGRPGVSTITSFSPEDSISDGAALSMASCRWFPLPVLAGATRRPESRDRV